MRVTFRTVQLQRFYEKFAEATRQWGTAVARRYVERINILHECESIADLHKMAALRFHELKGDRAGQHALRLTERVRLIVSFSGKERKTVRVEEVSKHYGD